MFSKKYSLLTIFFKYRGGVALAWGCSVVSIISVNSIQLSYKKKLFVNNEWKISPSYITPKIRSKPMLKETKGGYNPADELGTSLQSYYDKFSS